jgi:antitoxin ParD1/3/4
MMIFDTILHVSSINFSVPDDLREFVDERVARVGFSTPSEYMRHLIREDRKRAAQEQLEALLLEGLDSGPSEPWTEADVEEIRAAVRARLKKRRGAHGATPKG